VGCGAAAPVHVHCRAIHAVVSRRLPAPSLASVSPRRPTRRGGGLLVAQEVCGAGGRAPIIILPLMLVWWFIFRPTIQGMRERGLYDPAEWGLFAPLMEL
jgi:hypothetical protein